MCSTLFNNNATPKSWEEANPARVYHIHIYFDESMQATAREVVAQAKALFPGEALGGDRIIGKVGPHTMTNLEIDIRKESFGKVVTWLQQNNQGLSILIHPRTGDERKDHQESALWLGKPVPFNDAFFAQLKSKPKGPA